MNLPLDETSIDEYLRHEIPKADVEGWSIEQQKAAMLAIHQDKMNEAYASDIKRFILTMKYGKTIIYMHDDRDPDDVYIIILGEKDEQDGISSDHSSLIFCLYTRIPMHNISNVRWDKNPDKESWKKVFNMFPYNDGRKVYRFLGLELGRKIKSLLA
jgi:hypothetical protein